MLIQVQVFLTPEKVRQKVRRESHPKPGALALGAEPLRDSCDFAHISNFETGCGTVLFIRNEVTIRVHLIFSQLFLSWSNRQDRLIVKQSTESGWDQLFGERLAAQFIKAQRPLPFKKSLLHTMAFSVRSGFPSKEVL